MKKFVAAILIPLADPRMNLAYLKYTESSARWQENACGNFF